MVLYEITAPEVPDQTHVGLYIYNSREDASKKRRPKYELDPTKISIEIPAGYNMRHIKAPFILKSTEKEFVLSAQSPIDRDAWIKVLQVYNPALNLEENLPGQLNSHQGLALAQNAQGNSSYEKVQSAAKPASAPFEHQDSGYAAADSVNETLVEVNAPLTFRNFTVLDRRELSYLQHALPNTTPEKSQRGPSHSLHPAESWDSKYVQLCSRSPTKETAHVNDLLICELIGCFREVAEIYAKKIVDEFHSKLNLSLDIPMPNGGKSWTLNLPPISPSHDEMGTYLVGNFVFHLASDYVSPNVQVIERSLRQTSQELKSINAFNECCSEFNTALMTIIDYRGFRVIAYSVMPLDEEETLCLDVGIDGSGKSDTVALAKINQVGRQLNLKSHTVVTPRDKNVALSVSSTTKIHGVSVQGVERYYAINLVDLMPTWERDSICFRPEFIDAYQQPLACEAYGGNLASLHEQQSLQAEVANAKSYLLDVQLPKLVSHLDSCGPASFPLTTAQLAELFHSNGVNMAFLGRAAELTKLPHVRDLMHMDMIARATKCEIREKIVAAVAHFRKVEARFIEDEIKSYVRCVFVKVLTADKSHFEAELVVLIKKKFGYTLSYSAYDKIPKLALFHCLMHHCGVDFEVVSLDKGIELGECRGFDARSKTVSARQVPADSDLNGNVSATEYQTYLLARHLALLGPERKLKRNANTALMLSKLASLQRTEENLDSSNLYLNAALNLCPETPHLVSSLMCGQLIQSWTDKYCQKVARDHECAGESDDENALDSVSMTSVVARVQELFIQGCEILEMYWSGPDGPQHPLLLELYRAVTESYSKLGLHEKKLQVLEQALQETVRIFGKTHLRTAEKWLELGIASFEAKKYIESVQQLHEAASIFSTLSSTNSTSERAGSAPQFVSTSALATAYYFLAEALTAKGDLEAALEAAEAALKIREGTFDSFSELAIESVKQVAKIVLLPYTNYSGPATPAVKHAVEAAIRCYEREFKYLKQLKRDTKGSVGCEHSKPRISQLASNVRNSVVDTAMGHAEPSIYGLSSFSLLQGSQQNLAVTQSNNVNAQIMELTKTLIKLKLRLASGRQQEVLNGLPEKLVAPANAVKEVIVKLVHLTPIVYMNELFQRVDDSDNGERLIDSSTISELHIIVQLASKKQLGVF